MASDPPKVFGESPRARLLAAAVDYAQHHGISDVSLRELAREIGTSHRMLIYHFGSKEGLLVAVVQAVEAAQRDFLGQLTSEPELQPADAVRTMWRRFADPALWPSERLFFEIYGQALQGRAGTTDLLTDIVDSWLEPGTEYLVQQGEDRATARADSRLGVAVMRGLILDLLATKDREGVDLAIERYYRDASSSS